MRWPQKNHIWISLGFYGNLKKMNVEHRILNERKRTSKNGKQEILQIVSVIRHAELSPDLFNET